MGATTWLFAGATSRWMRPGRHSVLAGGGVLLWRGEEERRSYARLTVRGLSTSLARAERGRGPARGADTESTRR
ncbi:putative pollen-specific leucine-rich repeat extensin-like protein 3 [Iris pallida]|uniref:Pollen-specific leucine-rich repeat extensin-like protein 3 n=1 Tax=Iris pallida TaxID=29817 RepID=A0AAX6FSI8_IRIPA|nr:putative pollen-specific leucine-rich repeat extensin-like protein 3 [Iris pallida]